jgi:hypothetical protein
MQQRESILATLWRFIRPEPEELIFYLLIVFGMVGVAAYHVAVQGQIGADSQDIIASFVNAKESLYDFFNATDGWGRFFLFGFWFFIGTITYVVAWSVITMLIDLSNDVKVSSSFVHPKSFHKSDYWLSIASRIVLRAAAGITLVFYGVFWIVGFAPVWMHSFQALFGRGVTSGHVSDFVTALIGVALTLHVAAILLRLMLLRAHYSYEA